MKESIKKVVEYTRQVGESCSWKDVTKSYGFYLNGYLDSLFEAYPSMESKMENSLIFDEGAVTAVFNEDYFDVKDISCTDMDIVFLMGVFYASCDNGIIQEAIEYFTESTGVDWCWIEAYIEGCVRHTLSMSHPKEDHILMLMALVERWEQDLGSFRIPCMK